MSVFCISTEAPLIQQDILKRCQDALLTHDVSIRGLVVDGRDVLLSGARGSELLSRRVHDLLEGLNGVRVVKAIVVTASVVRTEGSPSNADENPDARTHAEAEVWSLTDAPVRQVQAKIDRVLENQVIAFRTDTTTLTPESQLALDKVAEYLSQAEGIDCEIRGYDSPQQRQQRDTRQNWVLVLQRALAAEDYLESRGIPDWRLSTREYHIGEATGGRRTDRPVDLVVRARN